MVFFVILAFLSIILLEVPGLVRKKMWRELTAFATLLIIGMALSILKALNMMVLNPYRYIEILFMPLVEWLSK